MQDQMTDSMPMRIKACDKSYFKLLDFSGNLDAKALFGLSRLCGWLMKSEIKEYIFDLTNVGDFCSSAIALIRNFEARLTKEGGRLLFMNRRERGAEQLRVLFGRGILCFENDMDLEDFIIADEKPFSMGFSAGRAA